MLKSLFPRQALLLSLVCTSLLLTGCDHNEDDDDPVPEPVVTRFSVTLTNLTEAQPLSPVAAILHNDGQLWQIGTSASEALERMAEGGDNSALLQLSLALASASSAMPLAPGMSATLELNASDLALPKLSVATMLVNTNDAFTGLNAADISGLAVGQSQRWLTHAYDAGTEANTEAAGTIPGPAANGEGFNASRNDVDFVAMHPGIVSADDQLGTSVLLAQHKFDNPVMRIIVTRLE